MLKLFGLEHYRIAIVDSWLNHTICNGASLQIKFIMLNIKWAELLVHFPFFLLLFRATPATYGSSQARGRIGVTAAGLCHSHSNARSELQGLNQSCSWDLYQIFQQHYILNPLSRARDGTHILMDTSRILNLLSYSGNSCLFIFLFTSNGS